MEGLAAPAVAARHAPYQRAGDVVFAREFVLPDQFRHESPKRIYGWLEAKPCCRAEDGGRPSRVFGSIPGQFHAFLKYKIPSGLPALPASAGAELRGTVPRAEASENAAFPAGAA